MAKRILLSMLALGMTLPALGFIPLPKVDVANIAVRQMKIELTNLVNEQVEEYREKHWYLDRQLIDAAAKTFMDAQIEDLIRQSSLYQDIQNGLAIDLVTPPSDSCRIYSSAAATAAATTNSVPGGSGVIIKNNLQYASSLVAPGSSEQAQNTISESRASLADGYVALFSRTLEANAQRSDDLGMLSKFMRRSYTSSAEQDIEWFNAVLAGDLAFLPLNIDGRGLADDQAIGSYYPMLQQLAKASLVEEALDSVTWKKRSYSGRNITLDQLAKLFGLEPSDPYIISLYEAERDGAEAVRESAELTMMAATNAQFLSYTRNAADGKGENESAGLRRQLLTSAADAYRQELQFRMEKAELVVEAVQYAAELRSN